MTHVSILVPYNDKKKILLQHRSAYKEKWANFWCIFGGHVEEGETPEEALYRELQEELAYVPKNPELLMVHPFPSGQGGKHVYIERIDTTQELVLDMHEAQGMGWFSMAEVFKLELIPHDREIFEKVKIYLENV